MKSLCYQYCTRNMALEEGYVGVYDKSRLKWKDPTLLLKVKNIIAWGWWPKLWDVMTGNAESSHYEDLSCLCRWMVHTAELSSQ